jgi:hypothetical protein
LGARVLGTVIAWRRQSPCTAERERGRYFGHGALQGVPLVSSAMASALLGAFAARWGRDAAPWWSLSGAWCGLAGPSAPEVGLVASRACRHLKTVALSFLQTPAPPSGGAAVGKRPPV